MKVGVNLKIDVSKIDKARLFKGEKGTYLDATAFIDIDTQDQYGNNGMITQSVPKDSNEKGAILGNAKVFWRGEGQQRNEPKQEGKPPAFDNFDDSDLPF